MGQGQTGYGGMDSHRRLGSQQNRMNTAQGDFGMSGGSAMPRGRGGRISRGTRRGGTGDQMDSFLRPSREVTELGSPMSMSSYRPGTRPGMTTVQTPDFMRELNETFGNSPFQRLGWGGGGDTMQVARSGGGRGGVIPTREEALQGRLDAAAIQNAAMQGGQGYMGSLMYGPGDMTTPAGVVDPYMVQQAMGQGNAQEAAEYSIYDGQRPEGGMPRGGYGFGGSLSDDGIFTSPAIANQYDLNFDGAVGADDLAMALKAQAAGRAFDPESYGPPSMDDYQSQWETEQGIRDQYGAQEMQERRRRREERRLADIGMGRTYPTDQPFFPATGSIETVAPPMLPGGDGSNGRLQTRRQRGAGRGRRRRFGHGGIIDSYGRRLI